MISKILLVFVGMLLVPFLFNTSDVPSPQDFIEEKDILLGDGVICVYGDYIVGRIADTKSMDPTVDSTSTVLIKYTQDFDDISIGDIIAYGDAEYGFISHRVIKKYNDSVVVQGDNNMFPDKYKVHKNAIAGVIVGIIY